MQSAKIYIQTFSKQLLLVVAALVMAVAGFLQAPTVKADPYSDRINSLQKDVNRYQNAANELSRQAATLQGELNRLTQQKNAIQAEVDLSQAKHDQLVAQIKETEENIAKGQVSLGEIIADIYVEDQISPIEVMASSSTIGEMIDKQEYRSSIRDQLTGTIAQIKDLRSQLNKQKEDVAKVLDEQKKQRDALAAKESEHARLVSVTRGQQSEYQKMVDNARKAIEQAYAEQRAYWASQGSAGGGNLGHGSNGWQNAWLISKGLMPSAPFEYRNKSANVTCGGGYPTSRSDGSYGSSWGCNHGFGGYVGYGNTPVDPWQLYNRECVSYVAWAASERFGKYVVGFGGRGMAYQFPETAAGYPMYATVNRTPAVGAVAILPYIPGIATAGHAMIVESVNGNWIHVSQYNFGMTGQYSTMDVRADSVVYIHFR